MLYTWGQKQLKIGVISIFPQPSFSDTKRKKLKLCEYTVELVIIPLVLILTVTEIW
jgi:hypothetical protein